VYFSQPPDVERKITLVAPVVMKSSHCQGAAPELVVDCEIFLYFALSETVTLNLVSATSGNASFTLLQALYITATLTATLNLDCIIAPAVVAYQEWMHTGPVEGGSCLVRSK
jgi:hypothetical protein